MAELSITSITVPRPLVPDLILEAGEAITDGQVVYRSSTDDMAYLAQSDGTQEEATAVGFAVNSAIAGQVVNVNFTQVMTINTGAGVTTLYFLSSTPGSIELESDLPVGDLEYKTLVAYGTTATTLVPLIRPFGLTKP